MFELNGMKYMGLNGGPDFQFNEAISLVVDCEKQVEIDYYWQKLSENGEEKQCGWLKDKFGLSWQIVPKCMGQLMTDPNRAPRVTKVFMQMKKLDIEMLEKA
jgi:predicted 3-demethylubiquinone-9 3-methyltransferase (glyoxalase superfamily)